MDRRDFLGAIMAGTAATALPENVISIAAKIELCKRQPAYFIRHYVKIERPEDRAWVPFTLWPDQETGLACLRQHRQCVILKARQLGWTWLVLADILHMMIFQPGTVALLFSRRDDEAVEMLDSRLKGMFKRLPEWLQPEGVKLEGAHDWRWQNGSRATAFPTTGARSRTGTIAVIDEAEKMEPTSIFEKLLTDVKPTVDAGGRLVILSTSDKSKPQSAFKKIYRKARDGENDYKAIFHGWRSRPERDDAWYAGKVRDAVNMDSIHQEYPATDEEALRPGATDKRFDPEQIERCHQKNEPLSLDELQAACTRNGIPLPPPIPGLKIHCIPRKGYVNQRQEWHKPSQHVCGADPAEGNPTSDDSAAVWLDADTGEECALLCGKFEPSVFANHLASVSRWYNNAAMLVERNNHGHAVLLWLAMNAEDVRRLGGLDGRAGWLESLKSKTQLFDDLADVVRFRQCIIHSDSVRDQLQLIVGATLRAPNDMHDDEALAFALAVMAMLRWRRELTGGADDTGAGSEKPAGWQGRWEKG